jgi:hypothetical protein
MKKTTTTIFAALAAALLVACGPKTAEEKVAQQLSSVHPLTADERNLASINGKQFYEKEWLPAGGKRGQLISCRPSDSNANGLVTCTGFIPQAAGNFTEVTRYCGYRPELVGCSNEDTVK